MFVQCINVSGQLAPAPVSTALDTGPVHPARGPGAHGDADLHRAPWAEGDRGGEPGVTQERGAGGGGGLRVLWAGRGVSSPMGCVSAGDKRGNISEWDVIEASVKSNQNLQQAGS